VLTALPRLPRRHTRQVDAGAALEQNATDAWVAAQELNGISEMENQRLGRFSAIAALSLALAACSASEQSNSNLTARLRLTKPNALEPQKHWGPAGVLTAEDFVGPDGRCAGDAAPSGFAPGALQFQAGSEAKSAGSPAAPEPAPTPTPLARAITLDMSECELVSTLGPTNQVEIGATERGERSVVLTYLQGERPGIYRFISGRLKSMERAPELPAAAKPAPAKKPGKKPAAS
jgi:hypothetical protein